ncbi:Carbohydrate-binding family 9 [Parapedobacter luteus]|uniref:Carbohydrate-binding family 9 n=1 Tax=Parapedobacter luteus TaxID=623280 RepID=A0A1T5AQA4_9SPHI|nr:carbohydrate-binding family 9-like protein [Parapedobacter luteus]SKB36773.1 Carbohydrate-binding family 9 [Parapedobacter luteus]
MKGLVIPFLDRVNYHSSTDEVLAALAGLSAFRLDEVAWSDYPYKPSVYVKIAHTADSLLLVYQVSEKHAIANRRNTNDPVYKDSCVEFFVSFDHVHYYNIEFNCLGTGLIGYGREAENERSLLPRSLVERIHTDSHIVTKQKHGEDTAWRLVLNVPFSVFDAHSIKSLAGMQCTGNFYKCGDELPVPHFVSWNRINHPTPNFHVPGCFGELFFQ